MTTFDGGTLADAAIAHKKGVTMQIGRAWRDNPAAALEGADGAYLNHFDWHPYDMVAVGDGADGVFYDYSVDGASSSEESPTFAAGYEYAVLIEGLSFAGSSPAVTVDLYRVSAAAWTNLATSSSHTAPAVATGMLSVRAPGRTQAAWGGTWLLPLAQPGGSVLASGEEATGAVAADTVSKLRVGGATFDAGVFSLWKRRTLLG